MAVWRELSWELSWAKNWATTVWRNWNLNLQWKLWFRHCFFKTTFQCSKLIFSLTVAEKTQLYLNINESLFHFSVSVSHASEPASIINVFNYTYAFPAVTGQNRCCENRILIFSHEQRRSNWNHKNVFCLAFDNEKPCVITNYFISCHIVLKYYFGLSYE